MVGQLIEKSKKSVSAEGEVRSGKGGGMRCTLHSEVASLDEDHDNGTACGVMCTVVNMCDS